MTHHVMIDLETWSTANTAVIRAIALIAFDDSGAIDTNWLIDGRLSIDDQLEAGRRVDRRTVKWWGRQPVPLSELMDTRRSSVIRVESVAAMQQSILDFFEPLQEAHEQINVWSRGSFDLVILRNLFKGSKDRNPPWAYWEERDARTIDLFVPPEKSHAKHHPSEDAKAQIRQLTRAFARVRETEAEEAVAHG